MSIQRHASLAVRFKKAHSPPRNGDSFSCDSCIIQKSLTPRSFIRQSSYKFLFAILDINSQYQINVWGIGSSLFLSFYSVQKSTPQYLLSNLSPSNDRLLISSPISLVLDTQLKRSFNIMFNLLFQFLGIVSLSFFYWNFLRCQSLKKGHKDLSFFSIFPLFITSSSSLLLVSPTF